MNGFARDFVKGVRYLETKGIQRFDGRIFLDLKKVSLAIAPGLESYIIKRNCSDAGLLQLPDT